MQSNQKDYINYLELDTLDPEIFAVPLVRAPHTLSTDATMPEASPAPDALCWPLLAISMDRADSQAVLWRLSFGVHACLTGERWPGSQACGEGSVTVLPLEELLALPDVVLDM